MKHAFSKKGRETLDSLVARPILYAFDFDGTLAPISPDRTSVAMTPSLRRWLIELNHRAPCAIVSGRALPDLLPRIDGAVDHVIGNHGLESPLTAPTTLMWAEGICLGWLRTVTSDLARSLNGLGIEVEPKQYTLTFHYQGVPDPVRVREALMRLLRRLTPLPRVTFGHLCVNVLPPGNRGKGVAAVTLMKHLKQTALFYIGDDGADEDVFELSECLAMSIRVGQKRDSRAQFYLAEQGVVEELIRYLVERWDRGSDPHTGEAV